jgi:hypothetical protein
MVFPIPLRHRALILSAFLFFVSAATLSAQKNGRYTISGHIRDKSSGELLAGATLYIPGLNTGTVSNGYGFFSLTLPSGAYHLTCSFVGYRSLKIFLHLQRDTTLNLELSPVSGRLREVEIKSNSLRESLQLPQMSVAKMNMKNIAEMPSFMGETDLIKALQLLPGVKFVAEGSSGMSIRGGGPDQNLILLDEATVYNAGHLMGFFSVFNPDAVKSVTLYKGDMPAAYGGRLSSLIAVRMKEGNNKTFHLQGGIGLISTRLTFEGPLVKNKMSFMVSGRRTYADLFLKLSHDKKLRDNRLYFYDLNTKVNFSPNEKNHFFLSGYFGKDVFKNDFFGMNWGNATGTFRWNHIFGEKLFSNLSAIVSRFNYNLGLAEDNPRAFLWQSSLTDLTLKDNFNWFVTPSNKLNFGFSIIYHDFFPGKIEGTGKKAVINEYRLPDNFALESAVYLSEQLKAGAFTFKYGLRFSVFNNLGPATIYHYDKLYRVTDSTVYSGKKVFNTYFGVEPRLGIVYHLSGSSSVKASYARNYQYVQQAQNSTAGNPMDIWFPANPNIRPQTGDQVTAGYYHDFKDGLSFSSEVYYKWVHHAVDFKDHADLLLNKYLDGEIRTGKGYGYGVELMLKKSAGRLTGWVSYTWSRSLRQISEINNGKTYPSPYDRPNDFSLTISYRFGKAIRTSLNWVYLTGQPVTFPVGRFQYSQTWVPVYSLRNSYRMADYHRLDLALIWDLPHKKPERKWRNQLIFSIYNAYNRKNPWVINFQNDPEVPNATYAEMAYLFGIIPTITYNFSF